MGLQLHSTLEPLLQRLRDMARAKFIGDVLPLHPLPDSRAQADQIEDTIENDFRQIVEPGLNDLITRFRGYYPLDGYDLDPLADRFARPSDRWEAPTGGSVYGHVAQACDDVDDVAKLVHSEQWQGAGAMAFHDNFLVPFKDTALMHGACARELATAANALAEAVELAKECVVWICRNAIAVLGGTAPGALPGTDGEGEHGARKAAAFGAILADSVALFLALTAPELELLDVGMATMGVGGGLFAESKDSSLDEPINFGAGVSVRFTLNNIESALGALDRNIVALDERINRGLETDLGPSGLFETPWARIRSPNLTSSAYRTLGFKGLDDPTDVVVVSVVRLYYAGYVTLPAAAALYGLGVSVSQGTVVGGGVQKEFPRSVSKFNEAVDTFRGMLSAVHDDLATSGQSMVTAARNYESADAYEAQKIKQYTDQIPSPDDSSSENYYYTPPPWLTP